MAEGFKEEQAEGLLKAMQEITLAGVATKEDIQNLEKQIQNTNNEIQDVRSGIASMKVWFMGLLLGQTVAILGVMFTLFQFFVDK